MAGLPTQSAEVPVTTSFRVKEYISRSYGKRVRGALYDTDSVHREYAAELLAGGLREGAVLIPSTVRTNVRFFVVTPHADCLAQHKNETEPVWVTDIFARVFPDVEPQHQRTVRLLGERLNLVRVPVAEDISANLIR